MPKYFTPNEVRLHRSADDIWVSYMGRVYDLTNLCETHAGNVLLRPIIANAGKDITHWFDLTTKDIRKHIDPKSGLRCYYCPHGRFLDIPEVGEEAQDPWWQGNKYLVGYLSEKVRKIRIINTLTSQENKIEVCSEDTMEDILSRYLTYNRHATSYTWKFEGRILNMEKTLSGNGIEDEDAQFFDLSIDEDQWAPGIHLYFNDDLTED